jgi:hypothetical protein
VETVIEKSINYREERTPHERIPKEIMKYQPRGSKSTGSPCEKMDGIVRPEQA